MYPRKELGKYFCFVFEVCLRPLVIWKCKFSFFNKKHLERTDGDRKLKGHGSDVYCHLIKLV